MDGFEATNKIKSLFKENNNSSPFICALTAYSQDEFKDKCKIAGMDYFITKPPKKNQIQRAIQMAIDNKQDY